MPDPDFSWVDASSPEEIASYRNYKSVKHDNALSVNDDRYSLLPNPNANYVIEPSLSEMQSGQMQLPTDIALDDAGRPFNKTTGASVPIVKRPALVPLAATPEGPKFATPKLLDLISNVMSPLAAGGVPVKAGEMVLGSGMVKSVPEVAKAAESANNVAPTFYSSLERAVSGAKVEKADASQWLGYLKNQPGVKTEELSTVLGELPKGQISKTQLEDLVKQNKVELKETTKGEGIIKEAKAKVEEAGEALKNAIGSKTIDIQGEKLYHDEIIRGIANSMIKPQDLPKELQSFASNLDNAIVNRGSLANTSKTKYHNYQLPGGENYKEMLLQLPENANATKAREILNNPNRNLISKEYEKLIADSRSGEQYKSSHWDEPNILAHIRMNDRTIEGKKVLHIEEIQSDWGQAIRKQGYKLDESQKKELENIDNKLTSKLDEKDIGNPDIDAVLKTAVDKKIISSDEAKNYREYSKGENSNIPNMPFKKTWDELALKRMIRHASENGYEGVSWTPGEAQAARYDLSKQLKHIEYKKLDDGDIALDVVGNDGRSIPNIPYAVKPEKLEDYVGKEVATKILKNASDTSQKLEEEGLKIGGEGMKSFYDKMLVDKANALGKKYGAKVEQKNLNTQQGKILKRPDGSGFYVSFPNGASKTFPSAEEAQKFMDSGGQSVHYLPITPELRNKAMKEGFPLFSSSPVLTPITHNPFASEENKKYKLIPVSQPPVFR